MIFKDVVHYVDQGDKRTDFLDRDLLHPVLGLLSLCFIMMFIVFQAVFAWAAPFMDGIEGFFGWLGEVVGTGVTQPLLHSLVVDGIVQVRVAWCVLATNFDLVLLYFSTRRIRLFTACSILA